MIKFIFQEHSGSGGWFCGWTWLWRQHQGSSDQAGPDGDDQIL